MPSPPTAGVPPQDRPAGSPRPGVTAPARGTCPAFSGSKSGRSAPVPRRGSRTRGACPPAPAPRRLSPRLSSRGGPALRTPHHLPRRRPQGLPAARRAHLGPRPRWWRWSSRSPSRRWPEKRRSQPAAAAPGGGDGGGGRRVPSGGVPSGRGRGARGGRPRPLQTRAGQGAAETAGHPGPRPDGTPPGPPVTLATTRRPIRCLPRASRPAIGRHREGAGV